VPSFFTSANQPYTDYTQCQSGISLSEFCGTYHQRCAVNQHDNNYDYTELVTYGPAHLGEEGTLIRNHTIYTAGGECTTPLGYVIEYGEYEVHGASKVTKVVCCVAFNQIDIVIRERTTTSKKWSSSSSLP
jgi:hypothetical protein